MSLQSLQQDARRELGPSMRFDGMFEELQRLESRGERDSEEFEAQADELFDALDSEGLEDLAFALLDEAELLEA